MNKISTVRRETIPVTSSASFTYIRLAGKAFVLPGIIFILSFLYTSASFAHSASIDLPLSFTPGFLSTTQPRLSNAGIGSPDHWQYRTHRGNRAFPANGFVNLDKQIVLSNGLPITKIMTDENVLIIRKTANQNKLIAEIK